MSVEINKDILQKIEGILYSLEGDMGVAIKDLEDGEEIHFNSDEWFATASTFKIFILIELFKQVDEGKINLNSRLTLSSQAPGGGVLKDWQPGLNPTIRDLATVMIQISDNTATDMLFDLLGIENINQTLKKSGYDEVNIVLTSKEILFNLVGLDKEDLGNKKWSEQLEEFERRRGLSLYPKRDKFNSDKKDNNIATPRCVNQIVSDLYFGKVINPFSSNEILNIMKRQQHRNQIHKYLPNNLVVANKSGSVESVRCDSGIVYSRRPFAITCFSKNLENGTDGEEAIAQISKLTYEYITSK